jgi:hypothetical protein
MLPFERAHLVGPDEVDPVLAVHEALRRVHVARERAHLP